MKEKKLTVTGDVDPVHAVSKLRKSFRRAEIVTVGPAAKEPEKKPPHYYHQPPPATYYYAPPRSAEEDPNSCVIC
ncbi:Heavy metal-associated isoprenylated plant protein 39 [Linum perenne]